MNNVEQQMQTAETYAVESDHQADRLAKVVEHLRQHGQSTSTAEDQQGRFKAMARAYRERRAQLEAKLKGRSK